MSLDAVSWAMNQTVGRSAAKLLLLTLAHCVNGKGTDNMVCFPSFAFLAHRTELDKKSVTKNMQWLLECGYLEKTGARHGRTGQVHEYRLKEPNSGAVSGVEVLPKAHHISPESNPKTGAFADGESTPHFPSKDTTFPLKAHHISPESNPKTGAFADGESTPHFPSKDTTFPLKAHHISPESNPNVVHGTSKEQVIEQVKEQKRARGAAYMPDGFPEFWAQYPNKAGKVNASKSWQKKALHTNLVLRETVMSALALHRTLPQWTKDGGQYVPHATTWLNQERYLDEVRPGTQAGVAQHGSGTADWWTAAGFLNRWEAENERCYAHNAHTFRDGKKLPTQAEVHA